MQNGGKAAPEHELFNKASVQPPMMPMAGQPDERDTLINGVTEQNRHDPVDTFAATGREFW